MTAHLSTTVEAGQQAKEMREILGICRARGVTFSERRVWLFFIRFTVSGSPEAIELVRQRLLDWDDENTRANAW